MSVDGAITNWIDGLKKGEEAAAEQLWTAYFRRLVLFARKKLQDASRRAADEEDVALSAFKSFCLGAEQGRFPQLCDREGLWALLVAITSHKATDHLRRERRQKRGGEAAHDGALPLDALISAAPTPEFAALVADQFQQLLGRLDDEMLRAVALAKMEGYTVEEIAGRLGCVPRTIKRKLHRIRTLWSEPLSS